MAVTHAAFPGNLTANGRFYGTPLTLVQRALRRAGYKTIVARGYYGSHTKAAVADIQRKAHLTPTGNIGRRVWAILDGHYLNQTEKAGINRYVRAKREAEAQASAAAKRAATVGRIIDAAFTMINHASSIHYTQSSLRMQGVRRRMHLPSYPTWEDCSSSVTWLYYQAGAADPNGRGYDGYGFTGTLAQHGRSVPIVQALPGDLVLYGPSPTFSHVACVLKGEGYAARGFSHGSERGPLYVNINYRTIGQVRRYF